MRTLPYVALTAAALLLAGAGCAPSPAVNANAPAAAPANANQPPTSGTKTVETNVTQDDLNKLKADIQGTRFDDLAVPKQ